MRGRAEDWERFKELFYRTGAYKEVLNAVEESIKAAIIEGVFEANTRIEENRIADECEISYTSVREALMLLEQEGYITSRKGCGYFVPELSVEDLFNINEMIYLLSFGAVKAVRENKGLMLPVLRESLDSDHQDTAIGADRKFHVTLAICSMNDEIVRAMKKMYDKMEWGIRALSLDGMGAKLTDEHRFIVESMIDDERMGEEEIRRYMKMHQDKYMSRMIIE